MFDTILGLPVHVLVIHGVVVLLPLMAIITAVVACIPRWRVLAAWPVAVIDAGMVAMTFVARESGEALQARLGTTQAIQDHAAVGRNLIWFAFVMFLMSVVVAVMRRSPGATVGAAGAVVAGLLVIWWTVRVGHTGADALWKGIVAATSK